MDEIPAGVDTLGSEEVERLTHTEGLDLLRAFIQVGPYLNQLTRDEVRLLVSDREKVLCHFATSQDTPLTYGTPLSPDGVPYSAIKLGRRLQASISIQDTQVPLYSVALPIRDCDGQIVGSVMLSTDITEAMRHEQELTRASRRLQALNTVATAISRSLDLDEVFQIALDTTLEVMGLDMGVAFLLDESLNELVFKYHRNMVPELVESFKRKNLSLNEGIAGRVARTGKPEIIVNVNDDPSNIRRAGVQKQGNRSLAVIPLKSRERVWGTMSVGSRMERTFSEAEFELLTAIGAQIGVAIENARLYQTVKAQLEELKRTQAQLIQAAKLSAVGQLVAGLAHELNNPLTAVIGYTQLLQESVDDPVIRQDLDRIHEDAQRSARIVRNLLVFARQKEARHQYASVNEAIEQTLALRAYQFREDHIDVELELAENLPNTMFDVSQMQQVFLNVMNNAHDSMLRAHGQGKLIIRTSVVKEGDVPYIRTEFIDDGLGLAPEVAEHLFEPFFTTKDVGEGAGLGLSISYGIVKEHNGRIFAENRHDGKPGACFTIDIPVSVRGPEQPLLASTEEATRRKNRVLIVDDEQAIVSLITRLLSRKGFEVDSATSGEVALRRIQERRYDLIISDIKMPGIGGQVFYERVAEKDPTLARRIIFSTGDVGNPETRAFLAQTHNYAINKPFNLRQIEEVVEKALQDLA